MLTGVPFVTRVAEYPPVPPLQVNSKANLRFDKSFPFKSLDVSDTLLPILCYVSYIDIIQHCNAAVNNVPNVFSEKTRIFERISFKHIQFTNSSLSRHTTTKGSISTLGRKNPPLILSLACFRNVEYVSVIKFYSFSEVLERISSSSSLCPLPVRMPLSRGLSVKVYRMPFSLP